MKDRALQLLAKIARIQTDQNEVVQELEATRSLSYRGDVYAEQSKHRRDEHQLFWDPSTYQDQNREYSAKLSALHKRFTENQKQLKALNEELAAELAVPA